VEFGKTGKLDRIILEKLARPEHLKAREYGPGYTIYQSGSMGCPDGKETAS